MKKKVILIPNIIYLICLFIILYVINIDKSIVKFIIVCGAYLLFELVSLILIMKNKEKRNLTGPKPSLLLFKLYKLGFFLENRKVKK